MIEDSDDDEHATSKQKKELKGQSILRLTRECVMNHLLGHAKKQRVSAITDEEDEEDEGMRSFSSRLTKFRKSRSKSCKLLIHFPLLNS